MKTDEEKSQSREAVAPEQTASRVLDFLETDIPDFLRDATVDAIHEAAERLNLPVPDFNSPEEDRKILSDILARAGTLSLRPEDREARPPLTPKAAAKLGEAIVIGSEFEENVIWSLILLLDEIAKSSFDQTRVENLAAASRDRAFALSVEFERSREAYISKRRAQGLEDLFDES